jgi:maleate isomerase
MSRKDYGSKGRVGVGTPQANPTVEPEFAACLPPGVSLLVTRLFSKCFEPKDRWVEYYERLDQTLDSFDTLKPDAFAFACTAASYVVGIERETREMAALSAKRGYPVITGGQAIIAALKKLGLKKIVIGAPYPAWVIDSCKAYYQAAGFDILGATRIVTASADTRSIYELSGDDAIAALKGMDTKGADAVLFTGSGMPSLRAIIEGQKLKGLPVLSTNLCMSWALCDRLGLANRGKGDHVLINGWQDRIAAL